jgi:hypothetical protein
MRGKDRLIRELTQAARSMTQGSLSELTRQCGDPSCACGHDPARRHGPHLYWKFTSEGQSYSVYVPAALRPAVKAAHAAWVRFLAVGAQISARNRRPLLKLLARAKKNARPAEPVPGRRPARD